MMPAIAKDYCGSHALQSLLVNIVTPEEKLILRSFLNPNTFIDLSLDAYGCYIIQKVYNLFGDSEKELYANLIINNLDIFINNQNGIKVVRQCINSLPDICQERLIIKIFSNIMHYTQFEAGVALIIFIIKVNPF
jgi:hypothetical protein